MVTANTLKEGAVVFMTASGGWSQNVNDGKTVTAEEADTLLESAAASVADCSIVAPYLIEVEVAGGKVRPVRLREQIRAKGPTIQFRTSA